MKNGDKPYPSLTHKPARLDETRHSKSNWQKKTVWVALICSFVFLALSGTACKSKSGSREFIPGKGWMEN